MSETTLYFIGFSFGLICGMLIGVILLRNRAW